jgi:hypothetical protein
MTPAGFRAVCDRNSEAAVLRLLSRNKQTSLFLARAWNIGMRILVHAAGSGDGCALGPGMLAGGKTNREGIRKQTRNGLT